MDAVDASQPAGSRALAWMAGRDWQPFAFQQEVWQAVDEGRSGMLHATTGSGKTYAVWLGMLDALLRRHPHERGAEPLRVLWLTPMRALASDTTKALAAPLRDLAPNWTIGLRASMPARSSPASSTSSSTNGTS
jgi:ATP-dependent Lhr-like helicase